MVVREDEGLELIIHWCCGYYLDEYRAAQVVPTEPTQKVEVKWSPP